MSTARIEVTGELWREMGGRLAFPLPPDYTVLRHEPRRHQFGHEFGDVDVVVEVPRAVSEVVLPVYRNVGGEVVLSHILGDPMYPEPTA